MGRRLASSGAEGLEQIGVRAGVGERENEFACGGVEIKKHPVVLNMAITKTV